jgi:tetratricopeptide (TPR) repeat protein
MKGWILAAGLGVLALSAGGTARGQDKIDYYDRTLKKQASVVGAIEGESPASIKIKLKGRDGGVRAIPAVDVVEVRYKVKGVTDLEWRQPFGAEGRAVRETGKRRAALLTKALEGYKLLDGQVSASPSAQRYIRFKIAQVQALLAQDNPAMTADAIKALAAYKRAYPSGWEIVPALKQLGQLQEASGQVDEARKTYEELADLPGVPKEMKQESDLLVARLYLRGGKYAEAEKRLEGLSKALGRDDPQRAFIMAYLADSQMGQGNLKQAEAQLREAIRSSSNPRLRGLAYNLLGDYYVKAGKPDEAFWQYLRVDVMYNEDVEEQARALYHLRTLFDKVKRDPIRARECANRLLDKRFAGTLYQRRAKDEKK